MSKVNQKQTQNIWEVMTLKDLVEIIEASEDKFLIVGFVLDSTPKEQKKMIKSFLKNKHLDFPNINFIYFCAKHHDLGRISLLSKNEVEYPLVYHLYGKKITVKIVKANEKLLNESFENVKESYLLNKEIYLKDIDNNNNNNNIDEEERQKILQEEYLQQQLNAQIEYEKKLLEQQKLFDKIMLLKKHNKKFTIEFLADIANRKKHEVKQKERERIRVDDKSRKK